ncbi:MAG: hypothetical protein WCF85_03205 [Rhodospirillaceae bacterium]
MAAVPEDVKKGKDALLVRQMAAKLREDIAALEKMHDSHKELNFLAFCQVRNHHNGIQGLIYVIQERLPPVLKLLPPNMADWIIQAKMKALTLFIGISREFVGNPPLTLTGSLTARDVLSNEQKVFKDAHAFFNKILMEQALDDKTADRLVNTLTKIEETMEIIDGLLGNSKNYLEEFE